MTWTHLHEAISEVNVVSKVIGSRKMAIEGSGVELREDVDLVDGAIDTVAHWNVDESVCAADGHLPRHHDHAPSS